MHPMYRFPRGRKLLFQGDIIEKSKLAKAMEGHQDYMLWRPDFNAFCIMTQTCDLVRGREAEFITLAVVRKITKLFDKPEARKRQTADRLRNIIQHRANTRFFYLYPRAAAGVGDDSVVDLRVMFALHKMHYDEIVEARVMSMDKLYAAHLGWMAGNVFSRIAMPEWDDLKRVPTLDKKIGLLQDAIETRGEAPEKFEVVRPSP